MLFRSEQWLRATIAPIEVQIRERQSQLHRRLSSIKRVHSAIDTLEDRIRELEQTAAIHRGQMAEIQTMAGSITETLKQDDSPVAVAA